jgi:hypothetical protein
MMRPTRSPSLLRRCLVPAVLWWLALLPARVAAQAPSERTAADVAYVLVINGADAYLPAFVAIDSAMRATVKQRLARPVTFVYETLDALRFGDETAGPLLAELIAKKYANARVDAIVLVAEPAVELYLGHLRQVWPQVPVVFHSVSNEVVRQRYTGVGMSGIPFVSD